MTPIVSASLIILFTTIMESTGLTILRAGSPYAVPITSAIYALGVVPLLHYALKYEGIGLTNFLWNVFSTLVMFAIGIYIFKERIHNQQLIGIGIALLGIALILMAPESRGAS